MLIHFKLYILRRLQTLLNHRVKEEDEDKQRVIEENEVLHKQIEKLKHDLVLGFLMELYP